MILKICIKSQRQRFVLGIMKIFTLYVATDNTSYKVINQIQNINDLNKAYICISRSLYCTSSFFYEVYIVKLFSSLLLSYFGEFIQNLLEADNKYFRLSSVRQVGTVVPLLVDGQIWMPQISTFPRSKDWQQKIRGKARC